MQTAPDLLPIRPPKPLAATLNSTQRIAVQKALDTHRNDAGALLPVLHAVQNALGYVPEASVPVIAKDLNLSRAEVHGVITFYHYFRSKPIGKHVVQLCRAEACQAMGARALEAHVKQRLGVDFHETTADGEFTLEPVYCLGNCACSPSMLIDDELHGRIDAERFDALLVETKKAAR